MFLMAACLLLLPDSLITQHCDHAPLVALEWRQMCDTPYFSCMRSRNTVRAMLFDDHLSEAVQDSFLWKFFGVKRVSHAEKKQRKLRFQNLEKRELMTVAIGADGWTVFTPSSDSRTIYVSSSTGNDANDGLTQGSAVATLAAGEALIRDGYADHLLLKRGDTWENQNWSEWTKSGRSADEPIFIGAYGSGSRPLINTGVETGFAVAANTSDVSNVAIVGLHFDPHLRDLDPSNKPNGIKLRGGGENFWVEDCYIDGFSQNLHPEDLTNVSIRRNTIINSYSTTGHSSGIFSDDVDGLLIEGNFLDHNGWHETYVGAEADTFSHNAYITHGTRNATIRDNIFSRGSYAGLKFQPTEGTHYLINNFFVDNGQGFQIGGGHPQNHGQVSGAIIYAEDNVVTGGPAGYGEGVGVSIANVQGGYLKNTLFVNRTNSEDVASPILFVDGNWGVEGIGVQNFTVEQNVVYDWPGKVQLLEPTSGNPVNMNITIRDNLFQQPRQVEGKPIITTYTADPEVITFENNKYYSNGDPDKWFSAEGVRSGITDWVNATNEQGATAERAQFFDPTRTAATYAATLGLTSQSSLFDSIAGQSQGGWDAAFTADAINDYFRAGFELDAEGVIPLPSPSPEAPTQSSQQPMPNVLLSDPVDEVTDQKDQTEQFLLYQQQSLFGAQRQQTVIRQQLNQDAMISQDEASLELPQSTVMRQMHQLGEADQTPLAGISEEVHQSAYEELLVSDEWQDFAAAI